MRTMLICLSMLLVVGSATAGSPATPLDQLLGQYFLIQKSLASDSIGGVIASASQIEKISRQAAQTESQAKIHLMALSAAAAKLQTTDLKSARNGFGELTDSLIAYLHAAGSKRNPPYQFFCSMAKKNWLQPDKEVRNPYYGSSMSKCGELVQSGAKIF